MKFNLGDKIYVTEGPFKGRTGIVVTNDEYGGNTCRIGKHLLVFLENINLLTVGTPVRVDAPGYSVEGTITRFQDPDLVWVTFNCDESRTTGLKEGYGNLEEITVIVDKAPEQDYLQQVYALDDQVRDHENTIEDLTEENRQLREQMACRPVLMPIHHNQPEHQHPHSPSYKHGYCPDCGSELILSSYLHRPVCPKCLRRPKATKTFPWKRVVAIVTLLITLYFGYIQKDNLLNLISTKVQELPEQMLHLTE